MLDEGEKSGAKRGPSVSTPLHADTTGSQFGEVRKTLLRVAADKQSNELSEKILKDFLQKAADVINAKCPGPEGLKALITALLAVACLLNASVGFLECILSTPWTEIKFSEEERRRMVNLPLQTYLLDTVLDFIYRPEFATTLPPLLRCSSSDDLDLPRTPVTRALVAAVLDGGTALHFAAARGSRDQVNWLLDNGADDRAVTHAGEVPIQLVPKCEEMGSRSSRLHRDCNQCRKGTSAPEACTSSEVRRSLAWSSFRSLSGGFWVWLKMVFTSLLVSMGVWGCYSSLNRPGVEEHASRMASKVRAQARQTVRDKIGVMRQAAQQGRQHLEAAMARGGPLATLFDLGEPGGDTAMTCSWQGEHFSDIPKDHVEDHGLVDPLRPMNNSSSTGLSTSNVSAAKASFQVDAEKALQSCIEAVTILQAFALKTVKHASAWIDLPSLLEGQNSHKAGGGKVAESEDISDCHIPASEQAQIYLLMAEAVLVDFRAHGCLGELADTANQRMTVAHDNARRLVNRIERHPERYPDASQPVGATYARILHANVCLLLASHAKQSATISSVNMAQLFLQRWNETVSRGLAEAAGLTNDVSVACLQGWCSSAAANLKLAAALKGTPSQGESLEAVLNAAVTRLDNGQAHLKSPVSRETVQQLKEALAGESAAVASSHLLDITRSVARNAEAEVAAAESLHHFIGSRNGSSNGRSAIAELEAAIYRAANFPRLQADVEAAEAVLERWITRADAASQLDSEVDIARRPLVTPAPSSPADAPFWEEFQQRLDSLGRAIEAAQKAEIPTSTAKRAQREMRAQVAAADEAARLQEMLGRKPCGSGTLKAAVQRAEAIASAASQHATGSHTEGLQLLQPVVQAVRHQHEVERTAEALQKAVLGSKALADLPRLEAAILAARKAGDIDADILRSANEVRSQLDRAAKAKAVLEAAVRALAKSGRSEDVQAVEDAAAAAGPLADLLVEDLKAARESLAHIHALAASEAKLARALKEGSTSAALARAVQEATTVGVKNVAEAKQVLKAMQNLEAAMQQAAEGSRNIQLLRGRILAAEQAGIGPHWLKAAAALEKKLLISEAKSDLELAVKNRSDRNAALRSTALKAALDRAEPFLADSTAGADAEGESEILEAVVKLAAQARLQLEEDTREQERIMQARAEEQRLRVEKQKAEREDRDRERKAKAEQARVDKERLEMERLARREAEAAEQARKGAATATCQQMRPSPRSSTHPPIVQLNAPVPQPSLPETAASAPTPLANGNAAHAIGNVHAISAAGAATAAPAGALAQPNGLLGSQPALLLDEQHRSNSAHFSSDRSSQKLMSPSGSGLSANSSGSNTPRRQGNPASSAWAWDAILTTSAIHQPQRSAPVDSGIPITVPALLKGGPELDLPSLLRALGPQPAADPSDVPPLANRASTAPSDRFLTLPSLSHAADEFGQDSLHAATSSSFFKERQPDCLPSVDASFAHLFPQLQPESSGWPTGLLPAAAHEAVLVPEPQRPCSLAKAGEWLNGDTSQAPHVRPPLTALQLPVDEPLPPFVSRPSPAHAAGALAFGAPGLSAFSPGIFSSSRAPGQLSSMSAGSALPGEPLEPAALVDRQLQVPSPGFQQVASRRATGLASMDAAESIFRRQEADSDLGGLIHRSSSAPRATALELAADPRRVGSPFPGAQQWPPSATASSAASNSSSLASFGRLDGVPSTLDEILHLDRRSYGFPFVPYSQAPDS